MSIFEDLSTPGWAILAKFRRLDDDLSEFGPYAP